MSRSLVRGTPLSLLRLGARVILAAALSTALLAPACIAHTMAGLRFGVSDSPNQFLMGGHLDAGRIAGHLRFFPSATVGVGHSLTTIQLNADGRWILPLDRSSWNLYAGGGFGFANYSPSSHDSYSGTGANFLFGAEVPQGNHSFLVEARAGTGDLPDLEFLAGFTFR